MGRKEIRVISAGGTLDKVYGSGKGVRDMHVGPPVVLGVIWRRNLDRVATFEYVEACRKDSLDMTENDREQIVNLCRASPAKNILITHGTDTMIDTARAISQANLGFYRIILTGASQPACVIANEKGDYGVSDAEFNIGAALSFLLGDMSQGGVFIWMNGLHRSNQCMKTEDGIFVPTD